ncbi:MAG: hypothetical protein ACSLE1_15830 [Sphingobium sp.]
MTSSRQDGKWPLLTKRFTADPNGGYLKKDFDSATLYDVDLIDATNIREFSSVLKDLESLPHCCIVRAEPTGARENIRRKIASENGETPPLRDNPRGLSWVMLDFDKLPVASLGLTNNEARLQYLVSLLPKEFNDVTYHYQWSASAGIDGWETLSAHLFFWLDQPWLCRTLYERFSSGDFKNVEVDPAPFTSNQPHYTAAPIFDGCIDPISEFRSGLRVGASEVVVLRPYSRPVTPPPAISPQRHYDTFGLKRFGELLGEIGPNYHRPILRAVAHYCAVVPMAEFDRYFLKTAIADAVTVAPQGKNRKSDYTNDAYLDRAISGGSRKYGRAI